MLLHFFCLVCQHTPSSPLMASVRQRTEQRSLLLSPFTRPPMFRSLRLPFGPWSFCRCSPPLFVILRVHTSCLLFLLFAKLLAGLSNRFISALPVEQIYFMPLKCQTQWNGKPFHPKLRLPMWGSESNCRAADLRWPCKCLVVTLFSLFGYSTKFVPEEILTRQRSSDI